MWADIEAAIVERLQTKLPRDVHVASEEDLERMPELRQKAPAAWVIYDGYSLGDKIVPSGAIQQVALEFFVVVAAKSAASRGGTREARDAAAAMASQVLGALLGYHVGGGRYLHLSDAPGPEYSAGHAHLPLAFTVRCTFKGDAS